MLKPNYRRVFRKLFSLLLVSTLLTGLLQANLPLNVPLALAASFTVNNLGDTPDATSNGICADTNGDCTLRAALMEVIALGGSNIINFSVTGAITLATALPSISNNANLAINGPGQDKLTLQSNTGTVFTLASDSSFSLTAVKLSQSGIFVNGGNLNLTDCLINGNPFAFGPEAGLTVYGNATVNIIHSTFSNIPGAKGSAIYMSGVNGKPLVTITNSTIANNQTDSYGAGIAKYGGSLTITNSTLANNRAAYYGGAIYNQGGPVYINNSTITANSATRPLDARGGGVYNASTTEADSIIYLKNSVVAGNTSAAYAPDLYGVVLSVGYNIEGSLDIYSVGLYGPGDQIPPFDGTLDPHLGSLQDNGGTIQTVMPMANSPAINNGNPSGCTDQNNNSLTSDQRGVDRPQGGRCDVGAVEVVGLVVDNAADTNDGVCDAANCTLREALTTANTLTGNKVIFFNLPGASNPIITLTSGSALPTFQYPILLDGLSQQLGATCANTGMRVEINGNGQNNKGFVLTGGSIIRGIKITNFKDQLISATTANGTNQIFCTQAKR